MNIRIKTTTYVGSLTVVKQVSVVHEAGENPLAIIIGMSRDQQEPTIEIVQAVTEHGQKGGFSNN